MPDVKFRLQKSKLGKTHLKQQIRIDISWKLVQLAVKHFSVGLQATILDLRLDRLLVATLLVSIR